MINLNKLTENQKVKALYTPDVAFNTFEYFLFDENSQRFFVQGDSDFYYPVEVVMEDPEWQLYLVTYSEKFDVLDWEWNSSVPREMYSEVQILDKKNVHFARK